MLKKAGIIAAAATAGLLAVSPLAFATTPQEEGHGQEHHSHSQPANVDYTNVEKGNLENDCSFGQTGPRIAAPATGGDSLLGLGGLAANVIAPITAPIQALNCNNINVSDVIDNNSNNTTDTRTNTEVDRSFNEND